MEVFVNSSAVERSGCQHGGCALGAFSGTTVPSMPSCHSRSTCLPPPPSDPAPALLPLPSRPAPRARASTPRSCWSCWWLGPLARVPSQTALPARSPPGVAGQVSPSCQPLVAQMQGLPGTAASTSPQAQGPEARSILWPALRDLEVNPGCSSGGRPLFRT